MTIALASGNAHKMKEIASVFAAAGLPDVDLRLPADFGVTAFDPDESGATFADNALIKARALYGLLSKSRADSPCPVLSDDSGLCVDALGGRPGILSARYGSAGGGKLEAAERNALLLEEVAKTLGAKDGAPESTTRTRSVLDWHGCHCRFVCAMVLLFSPDRFYLVQETCEGRLVDGISRAAGSGGFGYDPIVFLPEFGRTVAELSDEEKNRVSHRGKAGKKIASLLLSDR
jgi:XTP/dITP diphosphohydrolase